MTKSQQDILSFIHDFEKQNGREPTVSEICELTGKKIQHVARVCKNLGYLETKENLPPNQLKILKVYKQGVSLKEIAEKAGVSVNSVSQTIRVLKQKGYIDLTPKDFKMKKEDMAVYIKVVSGIFKGWMGYIEKCGTSADLCRIYSCGEERLVNIDHFDYKIVGDRDWETTLM